MPLFIKDHLRNYAWLYLVLSFFLIADSRALTFVYVDGDDAASMLYHVLGRNRAIQAPFAPYHAMFDTLLSFLPPDDNLLRTVSMSVTALSAMLVVVLLLYLVFDWLGNLSPQQKVLMSAVSLLAIPEFIYLGLVYLPSVSAMVLVLSAHLLARKSLYKSPSYSLKTGLYALVVSLIFAIGAAMRWDMLSYGALIICDTLLSRKGAGQTWQASLLAAVGLGGLLGLTFLGVLFLIGYSPQALVEVILWSGEWIQPSIISFVKNIQTLAMPSTILLAIWGFACLLKQKSPLMLFILLSCALVSPWLIIGIPKVLLVAFPALLLCMLRGFQDLTTRYKRFGQWAIFALALCPWVLSWQVSFPQTLWGTGFELRDYDSPMASEFSASMSFLKAGTAVPTSEAPRPLWGHFQVIFGGEWRQWVLQQSEERERVVDTAIIQRIPIIFIGQQGRSYRIIAAATIFNEVSWESVEQNHSNVSYLTYYTNPKSQARLAVAACYGANCQLEALLLDLQSDKIILVGYPSDMAQLFELYGARMQKISSVAALAN